MLFNNKIGIHISDGTITLCDSHHRIISGPFCKIVQDNKQKSNNICTYALNYPFRGSVVADFLLCESILREYINLTLPKFHFGTHAYFSVSPVSGETELKAIKDLFKFHNTYLSLEPLAFLHGIQTDNGIVISVNRTMIEVSLIKNLSIKQYKWKYLIDSYCDRNYSDIMQNIKNLLKCIIANENGDYDTTKYYIIGEKDIIRKLSLFCTDDEFEYELYADSSKIIVENIFDAPKLDF